MIAAIQNVKILLKHLMKPAHSKGAAMPATVPSLVTALADFAAGFFRRVTAVQLIFSPRFAF